MLAQPERNLIALPFNDDLRATGQVTFDIDTEFSFGATAVWQLAGDMSIEELQLDTRGRVVLDGSLNDFGSIAGVVRGDLSLTD